jgi:hypothetical protein
MPQATYDDANLLLRLYDLRREEKMRAARAWFVANFKVKTMAEFQELCAPGTENNARFRMVATYWDMAASFIVSGVLNEELFFMNSREALVVWLRTRHIIADVRAAFKDPTYLKNLETIAGRFKDYMERTTPGTYDAFVARIGG